MDKSYEISAEKTYRAIGRFIFEFSQVEYTIRDYVGQSIGLNDKYFSDIVESYDVVMLCNIAVSVFDKLLPRYMVRSSNQSSLLQNTLSEVNFPAPGGG